MQTHPLSDLGAATVTRLVLLANHVIASEPAALARLQPLQGRRIDLSVQPPSGVPLVGRWVPRQPLPVTLRITPAGLLEQADPVTAGDTPADGLRVSMDLPAPHQALRLMLQRQRPDIRIEGDAQLAEAVSWLMKNLRWDLEDDVARLVGVPPALLLRTLAGQLREALGRWLKAVPTTFSTRQR